MTAPDETIATTAETQAAADAALLDALRDRDGIVHPPKPKPTIGDNFLASASLIQQTRRETRLSEATLLKLFELQMMWALNNRQSTQQSIFSEDENANFITPSDGASEGEGDEAPALPEPNERITAAEE